MDYYVYVYIDPRNYEEFYYGKGRGSRKNAHLSAASDSQKAARIKAIRKDGLEPIIRVVAKDLSEAEALLVEKVLLWKLGRLLTNVSSGHYAERFRPRDTMHIELSGFDFKSGVFYFNVGEGPHREWVDFKKYGFISAGQGERWRDAIKGFNEGDVFAAYLKKKGFVGIGRITQRARPIRDVKINGKSILNYPLHCKSMADNIDSNQKCEYVALVQWVKAVDVAHAKWKSGAGIYTTTHVRASLDGQPKTKRFLEDAFGISLSELAK